MFFSCCTYWTSNQQGVCRIKISTVLSLVEYTLQFLQCFQHHSLTTILILLYFVCWVRNEPPPLCTWVVTTCMNYYVVSPLPRHWPMGEVEVYVNGVHVYTANIAWWAQYSTHIQYRASEPAHAVLLMHYSLIHKYFFWVNWVQNDIAVAVVLAPETNYCVVEWHSLD